jgi:hypothetical protein
MLNSAVEQTAGSHSLAAAAHRDRSATCTVSNPGQLPQDAQGGTLLSRALRYFTRTGVKSWRASSSDCGVRARYGVI